MMVKPKDESTKHDTHPPRWLDKLMIRLCAPRLSDEVIGDLHERFFLRVKKFGEKKARIKYWREVLAFIRPYIFRRKATHCRKPNFFVMLSNHFKITSRILWRHSGYNSINFLGLSLGLTAGILIMIYVLDERSYDHFHKNADRIYRIVTDLYSKTPGGSDMYLDTNGAPVGNILKNEFPEIESIFYGHDAAHFVINHGGKQFRQKIYYASQEFLEIFSFPLISGNPRNALTEAFSIIITDSMRKKYFGNDDALGKTLILNDSIQFKITAILKDLPTNSHIQFDMLISFETYKSYPLFSFEDWPNVYYRNYILLKKGVDAGFFEAKVKNLYMDRAGDLFNRFGYSAQISLEPLKEIYLHTTNGNGMGPAGSISRVNIISGIAILAILLACVNFINLATARSTFRAKEVGLRKISGSSRNGLIFQFMSESFFITLISFLFSIIFVVFLLPYFNYFIGKSYDVKNFLGFPVIAGIFILIWMVSVLAGYYPAIVISAFKPMEALKGNLRTSPSGSRLRNVLIIFQFIVSMGLVMGSIVIRDQIKFMKKQELGFDKDEIFVINAQDANTAVYTNLEYLKNELKSLAITKEVSIGSAVPGYPGRSGQIVYPEGRSEKNGIGVEVIQIDENYINTLGLNIMTGHNFDLQNAAELRKGVILNETAVSLMGWGSPEEAVGKEISWQAQNSATKIIGVSKDFHELGLQQKVAPICMLYNPKGKFIIIKYRAANTSDLIDLAEFEWKKTFPGMDFNYFFLSDEFDKQYHSEEKIASVFSLFSAFTMIIAFVGITGLISFMIISRAREIGIRKILGAGVLNIAGLFSKEFIKLILVANVLLIPVSWYLAQRWLETFAFRMTLKPWIFFITLTITLLLTLITISFQTLKAALANPVDSLRDE